MGATLTRGRVRAPAPDSRPLRPGNLPRAPSRVGLAYRLHNGSRPGHGGIEGRHRYNRGGVVTVIARIDQAGPRVVCVLLILLMAAVFVPISQFRLIDGDEGTYLLDARLVMEGQMLFHDLYWPQMFLTPYIYGAWMKFVVGYSWYGA